MVRLPPHPIRHAARLHQQQHRQPNLTSPFVLPSHHHSSPPLRHSGTVPTSALSGIIRQFCLPALGAGAAGARAQGTRAASTSAAGWNMVSSDGGTSGNEGSTSGSQALAREAGVGRWTGRAVFVGSPSPAPCSPPARTSTSQGRSGTAFSPISITSSPSGSSPSPTPSPEVRRQPTTPLPRPRAVPAYSSPISRTAYTPPRALFPPPPARGMSNPGTGPASVHPFFNRTFGRSKSTPVPHTPPPPASQRPRMVAHYSSTSESQGSTATGADSTFGSQPRRVERPAERQFQASPSATGPQRSGMGYGKGKAPARSALSEMEIDELVAQVESVDLTGKFKPHPMDARRDEKSGAKGKGGADGAVRPKWGGPKPELAPMPNGAGAAGGTGRPAGALARYGRLSSDKAPVAQKGFGGMKKAAPDPVSTSASTSSTAVPTSSRQNPNPAGIYPKSAVFSARQSAISTKAKAEPKSKPVPNSTPHAPPPPNPEDLFSHQRYSPAPEVVYTADFAEADALLSRLQGPVLGLDLEWPIAGFYKMPGGGPKKPIGVKWNDKTNKYEFGEGRTALIQVCDERLIVLIHLKDETNMTLPKKVIEIMQDQAVYKCGVAIQGDGKKLKRDFPDAFPHGINSLLELSKLARRVDPIGTGPGGALISLAKLTKAYTGKALDKEAKVRKSNWLFDLDDKQVQYAANDVYAGLQVYLELQRLADKRAVQVELDKCSTSFGGDGQNRNAPSYAFPIAGPTHSNSVGPAPSTSPDMRLAPGQFKYPPPRQQNALHQFRLGVTVADFAAEAQIKPSTAEGYICDALAVLADDTLNADEMGRLVPQIRDIRVRRKFKVLLVRLRRGAGEVVSDSDASAVELESDEEVVEQLEVYPAEAGLEQQLGDIKLDSQVEVAKGEEAKVVEHGWTEEELEAASMMSDSDGDETGGRRA